jgi:hypothetical protein
VHLWYITGAGASMCTLTIRRPFSVHGSIPRAGVLRFPPRLV